VGGWKASLLTEFTKRVKPAAFISKSKHRAGASLCIFVSGLFNGVLSTAHVVYRLRTNDCDEEVEGMWKEKTVGCCVALFELVFWRNWRNPQELQSVYPFFRPSIKSLTRHVNWIFWLGDSMSLVHPSSIRWMTDGFVQHWLICNWREKTEVCGGKSVPMSLCPPQISRELLCEWNRATAVRSRRQTACGVARPGLNCSAGVFYVVHWCILCYCRRSCILQIMSLLFVVSECLVLGIWEGTLLMEIKE